MVRYRLHFISRGLLGVKAEVQSSHFYLIKDMRYEISTHHTEKLVYT